MGMLDRAKAETLLTGRCKDSRKVGNNTYLLRRGTDIALRLHTTDVVTMHDDGTVTLDSDGWLTVTTKDRMNYVDGIRVFSDRGRWFVMLLESGRWPKHEDGGVFPYFDGMRIDLNKRTVVNVEEENH